jgi:hypothetical protein
MEQAETSLTRRITSRCRNFLFLRKGDAVYSQDETSEIFIGEWMEMRGIRDQIVVATKVCFPSFLLRARDANFDNVVHHRLQTWTRRYRSACFIFRQQQQIAPCERRSQLEEAEDLIHRHLVPALVGLRDRH